VIYLTISEGNSGDATQPLFATTDLSIINAVIRELAKRVRGDSEPLRLAPVRGAGQPKGGTE
jgi:hypothetical protein